MRIDILTVFPEMFAGPMDTSILGRAKDKGILDIRLHNIRDYSESKHKNTDDYPFGGGAGMVMMAQPIFSCLEDVDPDHEALRIAMAPRGKTLSVPVARELAAKDRLLFLCGHYEGIDERAMEQMDMELSIGDYVLTGGELPAMVIIDCVSRFIPGVLGSAESAEDESFSDGLLEYPRTDLPKREVGDTVRVFVKVVEGNRERLQNFEGIVIKMQGGGIRETFTVRRVSYGVGVERTFPYHSPRIGRIEVVRHGQVRRAKLYYLRNRVGKAAKIVERIVAK